MWFIARERLPNTPVSHLLFFSPPANINFLTVDSTSCHKTYWPESVSSVLLGWKIDKYVCSIPPSQNKKRCKSKYISPNLLGKLAWRLKLASGQPQEESLFGWVTSRFMPLGEVGKKFLCSTFFSTCSEFSHSELPFTMRPKQKSNSGQVGLRIRVLTSHLVLPFFLAFVAVAAPFLVPSDVTHIAAEMKLCPFRCRHIISLTPEFVLWLTVLFVQMCSLTVTMKTKIEEASHANDYIIFYISRRYFMSPF